MQVVSLHPGVTLEDVRSEVGWELCVAPTLTTTEPPADDELLELRRAMPVAGPDE